MSESVLRAGCAQILHQPDDVAAMTARHLHHIAQARSEGLGLLMFPESSLTGYPDCLATRDANAIAADGPELRAIAEASQDMVTVVGFSERTAEGVFYNSMAWCRDGDVLAVHRKINLPNYGRLEEGKYFRPGDQTTQVQLGADWRAGGLICADLWEPGLVYLNAAKGSTILTVPIASTLEGVGSGFSNPAGWDITVSSLALMYRFPVLRCNWVGTYKDDMTFWGGSAIFGPDGLELARAGTEDALIWADLDFKDVLRERMALPTVRDLRPDILHRELQAILPKS